MAKYGTIWDMFERWRRNKQSEPSEKPTRRGLKDVWYSGGAEAEFNIVEAEKAWQDAISKGGPEVKVTRENLQKSWAERDRIVRGDPKPEDPELR